MSTKDPTTTRNEARILTSASGTAFSNNLVGTAAWNTVENFRMAWSLTPARRGSSYRIPRVYCCPMTRLYLHVARQNCMPRRCKYARMSLQRRRIILISAFPFFLLPLSPPRRGPATQSRRHDSHLEGSISSSEA